MSARPRVGLLARDPLRIVGLQALLEPETEVVVLETATAEQLRELQVVILDGAGVEPLFEMIRACLQLRPQARLLVLGLESDAGVIERVVDAGAKGYLSHQCSGDELRSAVRVVGEGSIWAPRRVLSQLLERAQARSGQLGPVGAVGAIGGVGFVPVRFSARELQVLRLLVQGQSNNEIAQQLRVSEGTIKAHLSRMLARSGTSNRTALTMLSAQRGWV